MDGIGPVEPGLDVLLGVLTSGPTPDELAGEATALEAYRASQRPAIAAPGPRVPGSTAARGQARRRRRLAAAGTVAAAAALTVAAYTQALPAPLQNVAYHVLGFVGVPQAHRTGRVPRGPHHTPPVRTQNHNASQAASRPPTPAPPATAGPTPAKAAFASQPPVLSVAVARHRIVAGQGDVLPGRLTYQGKAVPGARLCLLERTASGRVWHVAGRATTGPEGRAVMTVSGLTRNAVFRLRGPRDTLSRPVRVIVIPPVSVSLGRGPGGQADTVTASSPLAAPHDLAVLQIRAGGRWVTVQVRELYTDDRVRFVVRAVGVERAYRVVLLPTSAHGLSVSNAVVVSSR